MNKKTLLSFLLGAVLAGTISVYATSKYSASDISFTRTGRDNISTLDDAINDLYENEIDISNPDFRTTNNNSYTLTEDFKICSVFVGRGGSSIAITHNGNAVDNYFFNHISIGKVYITTAVLKDVHAGDIIGYTSAGIIECWK